MSIAKDAFRKQFAECDTADLRACYDALAQEVATRLRNPDFDEVDISAANLTVLRMDAEIPEILAAGRMSGESLVSPDNPNVGNTGELDLDDSGSFHLGHLLDVLDAVEGEIEDGAAGAAA